MNFFSYFLIDKMQRLLCCVVASLCCLIACSVAAPSASKTKPKEKLVVILLDGYLPHNLGVGFAAKLRFPILTSFRWDYVEQPKDKNALPGFRQLHKEGVRAKWVNPIFPSLSYASWTTLSTGEQTLNNTTIGWHQQALMTQQHEFLTSCICFP